METTGVNLTRNFTESYSEIVESLQNKTLVVTTIYVRENSFFLQNFSRKRNLCILFGPSPFMGGRSMNYWLSLLLPIVR